MKTGTDIDSSSLPGISLSLRHANLRLVFNEIYKRRSATTLELAQNLNLSIPTVTSCLNKFISDDYVSISTDSVYTGGRKAKVYNFNALGRIAVGVKLLKESAEIVAAYQHSNIDTIFQEIESNYGHDAFLLKNTEQTKCIKKYFGEEHRAMRRSLEFKKKARVIIVDDNYEHLSGIRELIEVESDFDVVATATCASVAISLIKKYHPEIVLMDINMPEKDGLTAISEIENLDLGVRTIALTGYDDPDLIFRAMKIGAKGYVLKTMASAQLIYAIEEVLNGKIYLPLALSSRFFEYFQQTFREENAAKENESEEENLLNYLTQREEEVLELLTQGITYKGVANKLFISETTVKTHVNNIFQKLQVNDRTQAVLYAINNGFLTKKVKMAV